MNTYDYPVELANNHFLEIAGNEDTVLLITDCLGKIVWNNEQQIHSWSSLINLLKSKSIFDTFMIPNTGNLNAIFESLPPDNPFRNTENHLEASKVWPLGWIKECPGFPSKPGMVEPAIAPFFYTSWPLLKINILRISKIRFLVLIRFRNIMKWLAQNENKTIAFCSSNGTISGYSALFSRPLGLPLPTSLLGKNIGEIMKISQSTPPVNEDSTQLKLHLKWHHTDTHFPLLPTETKRGSLIPTKDGILWDNTESSSYCYLEIPHSLSIDNHSLDFSLKYSSENGSFPSIILRGTLLNEFASPDTLGYALTSTIKEPTLRFRKSCVNVRSMIFDNKSTVEVCIKKRGEHWTFDINGTRVGEYNEYSPFNMKCANKCYLFLRPGEIVTLQQIIIRSDKSTSAPINDSLVTAWYKSTPETIQYHVKMEESVIGNENYTLYQFHDVTPFLRNIKELKEDKERLGKIVSGESSFIGQSEKIVAIREEAKKIANSSLSILIEGETGTGKEVLAKFIHANSNLSDGPFVRIDCASLPESLIESELFGHDTGAFTGAVGSRAGLFEKAQGGTVFLDEVGNLPLSVQAKLLGVLESGEIQRLGGRTTIKIKFRLISASNEPLSTLLKLKRVREDLYFRLNQHRFVLPPLRDRGEDILLLSKHFIEMACAANRKDLPTMDNNILLRISSYNWPGNVRELRNNMFRAIVLNSDGHLKADELGLHTDKELITENDIKETHGRKKARRLFIKKEDLINTLISTRGNLLHSCEKLGISRSKLYTLIDKYEISVEQYRKDAFKNSNLSLK